MKKRLCPLFLIIPLLLLVFSSGSGRTDFKIESSDGKDTLYFEISLVDLATARSAKTSSVRIVESSPDLKRWDPVDASDIETTRQGDTVTYRVRMNDSNAESSRFFRVRTEKAAPDTGATQSVSSSAAPSETSGDLPTAEVSEMGVNSPDSETESQEMDVLAATVAASTAFAAILDERWDASFDKILEEMKTDALNKPDGSPARFIQASADGPVDVILVRTQALLDRLEAMSGQSFAAERAELNVFKAQASGKANARWFFKNICELRRRIAMRNPLLDFNEMVFTCFESGKPQFHSQQMAFFAKPDAGAGLYKVSGFKEGAPIYTDLLEGIEVQNGRFAGEVLSNQNPKWKGRAGFFTPEVAYDAKKVMFAWTPWAADRNWDGGKFVLDKKFRIFELDLETQHLRMLTDFLAPEMDEYDPLYLPNGRILFVSERHNGGQRCGNTATSGNMYTMKPDGSDLVRISFHETNERSPVVDHDGRLIYSRWDYVDRHAYSAQSMWISFPDGRNPRSWHGNYIEDDKPFHPISEGEIRPIPGSPGKYAGIAAGHHEAFQGNLCVIDINKRAKYQEQIRWFWEGWNLPGDTFLSTSNRFDRRGRRFSTPYPLSEAFMIVSEYDEVLLVDEFRNEILLYSNRDFCNINVRSPLPLKPRAVEPALMTKTYQGERREGAPKAVISIMNVYETDTPWPEDIKITELRIGQLLGRPKKPWDTGRNPWQGWSDGALLKAVVGTVPVEEDGSVYFEAPVNRELFFQLIDESGMAVQSMLSGTNVKPGEHLSCVGCHEDKWKTYRPKAPPIALQRPPSKITPEVSGSYPLNYHRLVKIPVFDKQCLPCHQERGVDMDFEYWDHSRSVSNNAGLYGPAAADLEEFVTYFHSAYEKAYDYSGDIFLGKPGSDRSRSIPMQIGARASKLTEYLYPSHHGVQLTEEEFRRVALWLDFNAQELGTYEFDLDYANRPYDSPVYKRQRAGEVVWPSWEHSGMDPDNPTGVQEEYKD